MRNEKVKWKKINVYLNWHTIPLIDSQTKWIISLVAQKLFWESSVRYKPIWLILYKRSHISFAWSTVSFAERASSTWMTKEEAEQQPRGQTRRHESHDGSPLASKWLEFRADLTDVSRDRGTGWLRRQARRDYK